MKYRIKFYSQILNFILIQGPRGPQGDAGPPGEMGAEVIFCGSFLVHQCLIVSIILLKHIIDILDMYYGEEFHSVLFRIQKIKPMISLQRDDHCLDFIFYI